jgi:periplasmic mercuric ion binding protein
MKTLKIISLAIVMMAFVMPNIGLAQESNDKFETVEIQTSAICGMCKDRIEKELVFERGVRKVELDSETKIVTIEYRIGRNDKEKLKKAISKIGYDADDVPADKKAHDKLPACCQKGNEPH